MRRKNQREQTLETERKILKETLDIMIQENSQLKESLSEIKSNVSENKLQLREKINSITDKNSAVEMLSNQIEILKQKFYDLQLKQKMQSLVNNNISEDIVNSKGNETNITHNQNQLMHIDVEEEKIIKEKENQIKTIEDKIQKQKEFIEKQQDILNEIHDLKKNVNFLKDKINENKKKFILYQYNCDIQNYFENNDLNNIKKILNKNEQNDNLIYLVTNTGKVYKFRKRNDLSKNNFINNIDLNYISTYKENEIINIREKNINEKNENNYSKKLNLNNNMFNNNLENIIKCTFNPNYIYEKLNNNQLKEKEYLNSIHNTRNTQKQTKINSYVNDLLKGMLI
jgi:hypothetical protein